MSVAYQKHTSVKIAVVSWISNGSGAATQAIEVDGQLLKVVTNPGAAAPTADYDITLIDDDGLDVAEALLGDRHTSNSEVVYLYHEIALTGTASDAAALPVYHSGTLTVTIANAGDTKDGVVKIYYR
jgi:hypothetical protein